MIFALHMPIPIASLINLERPLETDCKTCHNLNDLSNLHELKINQFFYIFYSSTKEFVKLRKDLFD